MKPIIRLISMFLALVMLLLTVACVSTPDDPDETSTPGTSTPATQSSDEVTTEPETTVNPHADPGLPSNKYDGSDFKILGKEEFSTDGNQRDIVYLEDVATNSINEAVRDRNNYVEDTYDVNIKAVWTPVEDKQNLFIERNEQGGIVLANICYVPLQQLSTLVEAGRLKDLRTQMGSYLDLTQSYWDQREQAAMSIANRLYFVCGDILTTDKESTWSIAFNRDLVTNNGLENPYDLVDNLTWTYAKMYEMEQLVSDYASHDPNDQFNITWGLCTEESNTYSLWQGSGFTLISKGMNDIPELSPLTDSAYDAMLGVATIQYDKTLSLMASAIKGVQDHYFDGTIKIFIDGKALFFCGSMSIAEWMRSSETDFGVLPLPKANVEQKEYRSSLSPAFTCTVCVQSKLGSEKGQAEIDFTSIITQALACESTATLLPAYYEKTLVYKGLRREEDERMLDLVFNNRTYDLSLVFSWASGLSSDIASAKSEKRVTTLKSKYDAYKTSCNKSISDFLTKLGLQ